MDITATLSHTELTNLAAAQFQLRQERASTMVRRGDMPADIATAKLRPWLAIACLLGADLPELEENFAELRVCQIFPAGVSGGADATRDEATARSILAAEICPRAQWQSALAAARDAAIRSENREAADTLRALATALRVTIPFRPSKDI